MLDWLFKYPPAWWLEGDLTLAWGWPAVVGLALAGWAASWWQSDYRREHVPAWMLLPRMALITVLAVCLGQPRLHVEVPEPVAGHVAVLLDDSLSMTVADAAGGTPADRLRGLSGEPGSGLGADFDRRFDARYLRFGAGVQVVAGATELAHVAPRAELGSALLRVAEAQDAGSLAAVVLAADSGVPGDALEQARLDQALAALRAAGTPVHVLDLANREPAADAMLAGLRLPARILVGDRVEAGIELRHRGLGGRRATLTIEDDGLILDRHELVLPADRERWLVRRPLGFDQVGSRRVSARIQVEGGDALASNDERGRGINVVKGPIRVLHFEAEPRFEVKFARRAVEADPALELVSLVRTAENKYYRLGISQPSELAAGFPRDPAELFAYQVLVLGSVAADLLDPAQQAMVADFVARRGGGLLLLGGRNSFAEGGYAGTPLAELMPVVLGRQATAFRAEVGLRPGPAARLARLLDFGPEESLDSRLQRLPPLTVVNPLRRAKPGARVLLSAVDTLGEPLVILADQPYGRGRVMSLAVRDTWRWQMHAAMPLEDQTHERLWRQMLRDLGREAGGRVQIESMPVMATPGARVTLRARALSADYRPLAAAPMYLQLTRPTGELLDLPMIPDPGAIGTYQAAFQVPTSGLYELRAELREPGEPVVAAGRQLSVSGSGEEFIADPQARQGLARIAEATGGRVLEPDQARVLGGLIDAARTRQPQMRQLAVWDAPVLLFALIALACLEWALRRRWRLP